MHSVFKDLSSGSPAMADLGHAIWRALNRSTLHIMFDCAQATEFFTATGTSWPAMHQQRQWRTMSGTFFGTFSIQNMDTAMPWRNFAEQLFNIFIGIAYDGCHQATFATCHQVSKLSQVSIWH